MIHQRYRPGHSNQAHYHDTEEIVLVLKGTLTVEASEGSVDLEAGDSLVVPPKTTHRFEAGPDGEAEWLIISPASRKFFAADGRHVPTPLWAQ
ncbi:MAG: cupin domain-containing protein [Proteobacteria bacterium]|nr:cupin domain-containing protein [Pseudomonadota bacterium]